MTPLTDDELLKLLESAEELDGPTEYTNNVIPFLTRYGIEAGEDKVPFRILYKLYKTYTQDYYEPRKFKYYLHEVIVPQGRDASRFYMLNVSAMKISKEYYNIISKKKVTGFERAGDIKHITEFVERYDLRKGGLWIEGYVLYDLYKERFRELKHKPKFGYIKFVRILKLYFESKVVREEGGTWFGINESYQKFISPKKIGKLRENREKKRRIKKNKKRKGKQKVISE